MNTAISITRRINNMRLTHEEIETLKGLKESGYKYIARDSDEGLYAYKPEIYKSINDFSIDQWHILGPSGYEPTQKLSDDLFQFIKWEDEQPYSIDELHKYAITLPIMLDEGTLCPVRAHDIDAGLDLLSPTVIVDKFDETGENGFGMKRLTTDNPKGNFENLMNFAFEKDHKAFLSYADGEENAELCSYVSKLANQKGIDLSPEEIMEDGLMDFPDKDFAVLYYCAIQAAELRARLKMYEDKLENGTLIELPCKVGDTVYVVTTCEHVIMSCDNDYFTGTGAITCPFERDCDCEECNDNNKGIFETHVSNIHCDEDGVGLFLELDNLLSWGIGWSVKNVGKTIFFTRKEAEKALEGMQKWKI